SDEIAVLERARAIIFAKAATRAVKSASPTSNGTISKKPITKTPDTPIVSMKKPTTKKTVITTAANPPVKKPATKTAKPEVTKDA
ncbi:hypothetical protein H7169_03435, partial [Candidatus Gracilibacteria bacterium]|nr:hypothetical protein [Candidatus Gracilibacteria bacterium]